MNLTLALSLSLSLSPSLSLCPCVIYTVFLDFSFAGLHKPRSILWFSPLFFLSKPCSTFSSCFWYSPDGIVVTSKCRYLKVDLHVFVFVVSFPPQTRDDFLGQVDVPLSHLAVSMVSLSPSHSLSFSPPSPPP